MQGFELKSCFPTDIIELQVKMVRVELKYVSFHGLELS